MKTNQITVCEPWKLIRLVAVLGFVTAISSLTLWVNGVNGLLNPFVALLTLVASPFFFWMSVISYRNSNKSNK